MREPSPDTKTYRLFAKRARLLADGRKALELVQVMPIADVLLCVGGSRARLYRAMAVAQSGEQSAPATREQIDPLML